ncbi:tetratricopeptide repeat protein, partial [Streptomyces mirabilis]|uniref:tetratricopeptide repeat protein n=1 Tax=Streptomyces mirabilis TaxID=68239 RepID=UPI0036C218B2
MNAEIAEFVAQARPYLEAALRAYSTQVLSQDEDSAVDAKANIGRRLLQEVQGLRDPQGSAELEIAVREAAEEPDDEDAAGALRQQVKRALRSDVKSLPKLAAMLPPPSEHMDVGEPATRARSISEDNLISRNHLASAYQAIGSPELAIPLLEDVVAQLQVRGDTHPDALTSRNNLASAYQAAGDLGRALPLYESVLAQRVRVLGDDHPDTLTSRNNLASAYRAAGDLGRALPLYESVLAQRVRVLGDDHPDTLSSRNNLASAYRAAGDLGRALPLYESVLSQRVRVLGDDHPDTL